MVHGHTFRAKAVLNQALGSCLIAALCAALVCGCSDVEEVSEITVFHGPTPPATSNVVGEETPSDPSDAPENLAAPESDSHQAPERPHHDNESKPQSTPQSEIEEEEVQERAEETPGEAQELVGADTPTDEHIDLKIYPLDVWGHYVPNAALRVVGPDGRGVRWTSDGFQLNSAGRYQIELSAPGHHMATMDLWHSGADAVDDVTIIPTESHRFGWVLTNETFEPSLEVAPVAHLILGLEHQWFASSGPPVRRGGSIEFLMDGEVAWRRVHERMLQAQDSIHISSWWWNSDFELTRDQPFSSPEARRENTIMHILEESPATKRVMLWDPPVVTQFNRDRALVNHAEVNDDFEFLGVVNSIREGFWWSMPSVDFSERVRGITDELGSVQEVGSPEAMDLEERWVDLTDLPIDLNLPHASYHQKYIVLDGAEAFVGGMNLKSTDWDSSNHAVFDPRRMEFGASERARRSVLEGDRATDTVPRKDYMVRVTGPIVHDVGQTFSTVWNAQRRALRPYSENSTWVGAPELDEGHARGVAMQLVHTMPAPYDDYSILESHINAIRNANDYILIEDQYWRTPLLVEAIIERMTQVPSLHLIVVTNPVSEWTDPGCYWTHATHQQLRARFADRYHVAQLKSFAPSNDFGFDEVAGNFEEIFIHSKLMIVDDVFMTIGSCNTNNRGFLYEYEMNINVYDRDFVSAVRQHVISNMLGFEWTPDNSSDWIELFEEVLVWNDWVQSWWARQGYDISLNGAPLPEEAQPVGIAYPLSFGAPADCALEGIGADITGQ